MAIRLGNVLIIVTENSKEETKGTWHLNKIMKHDQTYQICCKQITIEKEVTRNKLAFSKAE